MPEARTRLVVAAVAAVVSVAGAIGAWLPALIEDRTTLIATPAPTGLFGRAEVTVEPGSAACPDPVPLTPDAPALQFIVLSEPGTRPTFELTATGQDYEYRRTVRSAADGGDETLMIPIAPPEQPVRAKLCLTNTGDAPFKLVGTDEPRAMSATVTTLDGEPAPSVALSLVDPVPSSTLERFGTALGRASDLTGGLAPVWLLWPLSLLAVLGIPAASVAAVLADRRRTSISDSDRSPGR